MGKLVPNGFNLAITIFVALGSTAASYGMSVMSSVIGQPTFYTTFNLAPQGQPGYNHTSTLIGAFNGLNSAGSALGAISAAWIAHKWGRKPNLIIGAGIEAVGAALCAGSVNAAMFLVARFIAGWGIGMLIVGVPMYQAECASPASRGFMVSMHGVMIAVGYTSSAWIGFGCYFANPDNSFPWRFPLAFQCVPALLLCVGGFWIPETPRYLLQMDKADEALAVLLRIHKSNEDLDGSLPRREFVQMQEQQNYDRSLPKQHLFSSAPNRRRAITGFLLMFCNQFTGVLVIANYGVLIYTSLGMTTFMPLLLSSLWVTLAFPGNVFTAFFIDRIGRRPFLLIGVAGVTCANIFECALQARYLGTDNKAGQKAGVFFIFMFIFFWSSFLDASQYLYLSEIFPTQIRSQGIAFGTFGLYCGTIIVLTVGPIALDQITWKFFLVLILVPAVEWVLIFFFCPETAQRSLDDINQAFGEKVALHYYGATAEEEERYNAATVRKGDWVRDGDKEKGGVAYEDESTR